MHEPAVAIDTGLDGWQPGTPLHAGRTHHGDGDPVHAGAAAVALDAGHLLHAQHRGGVDRDDGGGLHEACPGLCGVPDRAAADDAAASGAQRRLHPGRADGGPHRTGGCGGGDRGVRHLPDRWQLRGRPDRVPDPGGDQLRRHHQGRGAHCRGWRTFHPGCDAGQADGHRRRPQRGAARREGGQAAPCRGGRGSRLLRQHGRCVQVRARRCDRRHPDPDHQHRRRFRHRHGPAWPVHGSSGRQLHHPGRR